MVRFWYGRSGNPEIERPSLQIGLRRFLVDLQQAVQSFGRGPVNKSAPVIGWPSDIPKPDAALSFDLFQIRTAIRRKDEGYDNPLNAAVRPRPAGSLGAALKAEATRVTLRLVDMGRDILVPPLGLDHGDTARPDEKRVVGRSAFRRPFGDSEVASLRRPGSGCVPERWRIDLPATGADRPTA